MNDILRLHTDCDGVVWCGQNGVRAINSKLSPAEFVYRNAFKEAKVVRVLGTRSNALLIVRAYDSQKNNSHLPRVATDIVLKAKGPVLEIGSPLICPTASLRKNPVEVLQRMWQLDTNARLVANWRRVDSDIFNSYLLSLNVLGMYDKSTAYDEAYDKAASIFRYHPLFRFFGFFSAPNMALRMRWVSEVLDPRWFIHSDKPNRMTKLTRFLGLTPDNFKSIMSAKETVFSPECVEYKATLTYGCWKTMGIDEVDYAAPHNFLWRIYKQRGYGWEGALAASKAFVRFAFLQWSDNLNSSRRPLFDPETYFKSSKEVEAYLAYVNSRQLQG